IFRHVAMFLLVVIGWTFFRAANFSMAAALLQKMWTPTSGDWGVGSATMLGFIPLAAVWAMLGPNAFDLFENFRWKNSYGYALAAAFGACLAMLASGGDSPFLYFQ